MPRPTIEAFLDHGVVARTVDTGLDDARQTWAALAEAGIDLEAATDRLEEEGIATFVKSYDALIAGVEGKRSQLATAAD
jgi:transaldolase